MISVSFGAKTMIPIVTVTLNPALDVSAAAPAVTAGPKIRLSGVNAEPGGGGLNVARAIKLLGGQAQAIAAIGGATGERLLLALRAQGLETIAFPITLETRQSLSVTSAETGEQYRFVFPGPRWTDAMADSMIALARRTLHETGTPGFVVVSGSQPEGVPLSFNRQICAALTPWRLIIDTSGAALAELVAAPDPEAVPFVLRMDHAESEALAAWPLTSVEDSVAFAQSLVARGVARHVIVARGAEGSILASSDHAYWAQPPMVRVVSAIGAGDSFVAGFTLALAQGQAMPDALVLGTAAAAAAVMTPGTELCRSADVDRVLPDVRCMAFPGSQAPIPR